MCRYTPQGFATRPRCEGSTFTCGPPFVLDPRNGETERAVGSQVELEYLT